MNDKNIETFIGAGKLRFGGYHVGNVTNMVQTIETETKTVPSRAQGGGNHDTYTLIKSIKVVLGLSDFDDDNMARALQAIKVDIVAGVMPMETVKAAKGGVVAMPYLVNTEVAATVTDKDAVQTFAAGTDYILTTYGVEILESGAIDDAEEIEITATALATTALEVLAGQPLVMNMVAEVVNLANNTPLMVEYYKFKTSPMTNFSPLTDDFGELSLEGEVLADNTRGGDKSAFMRVTKIPSVKV